MFQKLVNCGRQVNVRSASGHDFCVGYLSGDFPASRNLVKMFPQVRSGVGIAIARRSSPTRAISLGLRVGKQQIKDRRRSGITIHVAEPTWVLRSCASHTWFQPQISSDTKVRPCSSNIRSQSQISTWLQDVRSASTWRQVPNLKFRPEPDVRFAST